MKAGDLVYIHDSFGPMPVDLFAVITQVKQRLPALDYRYPPVSIELLVFKEQPKICSWFEPHHLMLVEEGYDL